MSKYRIHTWTCLALLVLTIVGALFGYNVLKGKDVHAASVQKCGQWSIIPSANPTSANFLNDVAVISANDVWTVGSAFTSKDYSRTLVEHWNGKAWKTVSSPFHLGYLRGVAALSTNNVWAVGDNVAKTIIEHWDGVAWKIIASPNVARSKNNLLFHVAAASANDIWAVGYSMNSANIFRTLVEHWNGTVWKVISSPNVGQEYNTLNSVAVVSANDVWSVGDIFGSTSIEQTLVEHWNGSNWQIVASPNPGSVGNYLQGVSSISANNVWAVGGTINSNNMELTLVEHWNGTSWQVVTSPSPTRLHAHAIPNSGGEPTTLFGMAVISANSIWAVGDYPNSNNIYQTLIEHWNGKTWSIVSSPNAGSANSYLRNAARIPNTTWVWSVGYSASSVTTANTLTEFYC